MIAIRRIALLSFPLLAVVACGKSGSSSTAGSASVTSAAPAPKGGSCNEAKAGICVEYTDNPLGMAEGACTGLFKGTYAKTACPTDNVLGTCQRKDEKQVYYFGNGVAAWVEDAKEDCEKNALTPGTFTASANAEQTAKDKAIPTADRIQGSCQHKDGTCEDIVGRMADIEKSMCEDGGNGTYAENKACPSDGLVGSCVKHGKIARYYTANLKTTTPKDITTDCEDSFSKGHFYPGPAMPAAKAAPAGKAAGAGVKPSGKAKK